MSGVIGGVCAPARTDANAATHTAHAIRKRIDDMRRLPG
jgi:hypothetical protein